MIDEKLKADINSIIDKHKRTYLLNQTENDALIEFQNNLKNACPAADVLADDLLVIVNKHIVENDIDDSDEIAEFTHDQISDFRQWCILGNQV